MEPATLPNEYNALLRHVVTALGVALVSRGLVTADDWQLYGGFIMSVAPSIIAFIAARRNKRNLKALEQVAVKNELAKPEVATLTEAKQNVTKQVAEAIQSGTPA